MSELRMIAQALRRGDGPLNFTTVAEKLDLAAARIEELKGKLLEANREVGYRDAQIDLLVDTLTAFQAAVGTIEVPLLDPESHTPTHLKGAVFAGQTQPVVDVVFIDGAWWWVAAPGGDAPRRQIPVTDHGTVEVYQRVDCRTCKGTGERTVEVFGVSLDPDGLTGGPEAGS